MGRTFDLNCTCGGMMLGWSSDPADADNAARIWRQKHSGPGHAITTVKMSVAEAARLACAMAKEPPADAAKETAYVPTVFELR